MSLLNKKAQAAMFIIIGLIIVVAIGIGVYLAKDRISLPSGILPGKASTVDEYVTRCLVDVGTDAITLVAYQGGYIYESNYSAGNTVDLNDTSVGAKIGKGFEDRKSTLVPLEVMHQEISSYIANALPGCINGFESFKGEAKAAGVPVVETKIGLDSVNLRLEYPVSSGNVILSSFVADIPLRLGYLQALANAAIQKQMQYPDHLDFTFLDELAQGTFNNVPELEPLTPEQQKLQEDYLAAEKEAWVGEGDDSETKENKELDGALTDALSQALSQIPESYALNGRIDIVPVEDGGKHDTLLLVINDSNLVFMTALKFSKNPAPKIIMNDKIILAAGQQYSYKVQAEDDGPVVFSDETHLFDISSDGTIDFLPEVPGEYDVPIIATDEHGNFDRKIIRFVVEEYVES